MSNLLQPDRALLYPQFETYRLHSLDADDDISSYALPGGGATQSRVGYNHHHLSFKEVRDRIGWDHLAVGSGGRGMYVDTEWKVVGFQLDVSSQHWLSMRRADNQGDLKPAFTELAALPIPVSSKELAHEPGFPSATQLDDTHWAISTGSGSIYILTTSSHNESFTGNFTARYDLDTPCLLRTSHLVSSSDCRLIITRPSPPIGGGGTDKTFDMIEVSFDPTLANSVDEAPGHLEAKWLLQSPDLPYWSEWYGEGWLVLSAEEYTSTSEAELAEESTPTPATGPDGERLWPFSWTQTSDSISMTIPFPAGTKRSDISIELGPDMFNLSMEVENVPILPPLSEFMDRHCRTWFSEIDAKSSTFTFNEEKALLELELVKAEDHSRWPSVFTPTVEDEEADMDEEDVPETFDSATLAAVKASLDSIKTRQPDEPITNHAAMPSLLNEDLEIDEEDDELPDGPFGDKGSKVGRGVYISYIKDGVVNRSKTTVTVVSLPISSAGGSGTDLIVKSAIDGLCYRSPQSDPTSTAWTHASTTPALAFVLSSKRDIRLVRHISDSSNGTTVLAFDAGSTGEQAQGNVYVYYPPDDKMYAKQGVVGVSGREKGALLGVGRVDVGGKDVVVVLCEKELVVLHGVL
jgi:hypothetical protein